MPYAPNVPCRRYPCPNLVPPNTGGLCLEHAAERARQKPPRPKRPSPAKQGYDRQWRKKRKRFLLNNPYCEQCGKPATEVDHIIPLAQGGTEDEGNYSAKCKSCHSRKTAKQSSGWGRGTR